MPKEVKKQDSVESETPSEDDVLVDEKEPKPAKSDKTKATGETSKKSKVVESEESNDEDEVEVEPKKKKANPAKTKGKKRPSKEESSDEESDEEEEKSAKKKSPKKSGKGAKKSKKTRKSSSNGGEPDDYKVYGKRYGMTIYLCNDCKELNRDNEVVEIGEDEYETKTKMCHNCLQGNKSMQTSYWRYFGKYADQYNK